MGSAALAYQDQYLTRPDAAAYLSERLGRRVTAGSLRQWAYRKIGPPFVLVMGRATYAKSDLDTRIAEQTRK